jgi:hypothetical protein
VDGFTLYSGGATGADTLFGTNAERYGIAEQHYSFRHHKNCRSRGRVILDEPLLRQADDDLLSVIGEAFQRYQGSGKSVEKRWQRDWYQVQRAREIFAVVKNIESLLDFTQGKIEGTAIAVALAIKTRRNCLRIHIYDQASSTWYVWQRDSEPTEITKKVLYRRIEVDTREEVAEMIDFEPVADEDKVRITKSDFTGIGTRELSRQGVDAINGLFERSF